jgi:hypothetical protein
MDESFNMDIDKKEELLLVDEVELLTMDDYLTQAQIAEVMAIRMHGGFLKFKKDYEEKHPECRIITDF